MNKTPIKIQPGDEMHLTILMATYNLNLVVGQDRQRLLGYGRAAFDAGRASALPAQAQETAKLPQAEGADWFMVLCPRDGVVFCYEAELGRSFGHDHIKDAMEDHRASLAKNWVVRPAYAAQRAAAQKAQS